MLNCLVLFCLLASGSLYLAMENSCPVNVQIQKNDVFAFANAFHRQAVDTKIKDQAVGIHVLSIEFYHGRFHFIKKGANCSAWLLQAILS